MDKKDDPVFNDLGYRPKKRISKMRVSRRRRPRDEVAAFKLAIGNLTRAMNEMNQAIALAKKSVEVSCDQVARLSAAMREVEAVLDDIRKKNK